MIARLQIAEVLVASITSDAVLRKTFELVAERGPAPKDLEPLFAALQADPLGTLDAVLDSPNMPLSAEPASARHDLERNSA